MNKESIGGPVCCPVLSNPKETKVEIKEPRFAFERLGLFITPVSLCFLKAPRQKVWFVCCNCVSPLVCLPSGTLPKWFVLFYAPSQKVVFCLLYLCSLSCVLRQIRAPLSLFVCYNRGHLPYTPPKVFVSYTLSASFFFFLGFPWFVHYNGNRENTRYAALT